MIHNGCFIEIDSDDSFLKFHFEKENSKRILNVSSIRANQKQNDDPSDYFRTN